MDVLRALGDFQRQFAATDYFNEEFFRFLRYLCCPDAQLSWTTI